MDWLWYSLAATTSLGVSLSLYKLPSYKGYSTFFSTFWTNVFSWGFVLLALLTIPSARQPDLGSVSWYAMLWGALFAMTMVLQKIMLQRVETNAAYPVTSSLGSMLTVAIGIIVLSERITLIQTVGIVVILLSVFLFTQKKGSFPLDRRTLFLSLGIIASSTASKYVQKMAATHEFIGRFMVWQYFGAAIFALLIAGVFEKKKFPEIFRLRRYWKGSMLIGFFSVLGGYTIFRALSLGPLSGVYAIHPGYTIVAAILGAIFFGEHLTKKKLAYAALSVVGVILLKIG